MRLVPVLLTVAAVTLAAPAAGQIPQRFENLQVLPKDIARDSLLSIMRGFSFALGVRCVHCHVGEDSPTLAGVDFKSDDRAPKRTAREMLRMVADINTRLAALPPREAPLQVRCMTCHRGIHRPITLEDSLYRIVSASGGAAAVTGYDSLRAEWHGQAAFDFGPMPLVRLAERLVAESRYEDALAVLRRNTEAFPRFWNSYWLLGRSYEGLNRRDEAVAAYRAVLERLPNHPGATARLRALAPPDPTHGSPT
jgi:tetratricopeptide (TPR) repeat protein